MPSRFILGGFLIDNPGLRVCDLNSRQINTEPKMKTLRKIKKCLHPSKQRNSPIIKALQSSVGDFRHLSKVAGGLYAEKIHRGERPFGRIADGKEPSHFLNNVGIPKGRRLAAAEELE